jgi:hypothetical protein
VVMGDAKSSVLILMPSRDQDWYMFILPAVVAALPPPPHAFPSICVDANSNNDETKPSSASAASVAAQTSREVASLSSLFPRPLVSFQIQSSQEVVMWDSFEI